MRNIRRGPIESTNRPASGCPIEVAKYSAETNQTRLRCRSPERGPDRNQRNRDDRRIDRVEDGPEHHRGKQPAIEPISPRLGHRHRWTPRRLECSERLRVVGSRTGQSFEDLRRGKQRAAIGLAEPILDGARQPLVPRVAIPPLGLEPGVGRVGRVAVDRPPGRGCARQARDPPGRRLSLPWTAAGPPRPRRGRMPSSPPLCPGGQGPKPEMWSVLRRWRPHEAGATSDRWPLARPVIPAVTRRRRSRAEDSMPDGRCVQPYRQSSLISFPCTVRAA